MKLKSQFKKRTFLVSVESLGQVLERQLLLHVTAPAKNTHHNKSALSPLSPACLSRGENRDIASGVVDINVGVTATWNTEPEKAKRFPLSLSDMTIPPTPIL